MAGNLNFKKIFFSFLFASLFLSGLAGSIYFGLEPRPIPKIKLSGVASPMGFSDAVFQRLSEEFQNTNLFFVGVGPEPEQQDLAQELIKKFASINSSKGVKLYLDPQLTFFDQYQNEFVQNFGSLFTNISSLSLLSQYTFLISPEALTEKIIVVAPNVFVSQILKESPLHKLKKEFLKTNQLPQIFTLSLGFLPNERTEENKVMPPCLVDQFDKQGTGALGCIILQSARPNYRKKKPDGLYLGLFNQIGENDYLLLYRKNRE
ncbi:MAG TPA: hypothetical protein PLJ21_10165 [Pseudobdellovibrionaceae bacterium]|nr:hypothetical protein [Pseudobdellovibrionaceae bacterium]